MKGGRMLSDTPLQKQEQSDPKGGLAEMAGGWPGSEDVVHAVNETTRSLSRQWVELGDDGAC